VGGWRREVLWFERLAGACGMDHFFPTVLASTANDSNIIVHSFIINP
jgi:hypothetical protein